MRRRFGRGRGQSPAGDGRHAAIDAAAIMTRIAESGLVATPLEPLSLEGVSDGFAALGAGSGEAGELLVAYSPRSGSQALLALLALAASREGFEGSAVAVAPEWSPAARRLLGLVTPRAYALRALAAPQLEPQRGSIEAGAAPDPLPLAPERVAGCVAGRADRELFRRALAGFEGLAAKHAGAVRGSEERVELMLLARRVAALEAGPSGVRLQMILPERSLIDLNPENLATALDRLEGSLRKRLNDRKVHSSDDGLRAALLPVLERAGELRGALAWPLSSGEDEAIDLVGIGADDRLVAAAARSRLDLEALAGVLSALTDPRLRLPLLWAGDGPLRAGTPRVLLAAREFDAVTLAVLSGLGVAWDAFDIVSRRAGDWGLERRDAGAAPLVASAAAAPGQRSRRSRQRGPREDDSRNDRPARSPEREREPEPEREDARESGRERERGREPERARESVSLSDEAPARGASTPRFEEVSLFDLEDDSSGEGGERGARRRGRGRRRGRRGRTTALGEASEPRETSPREAASDEQPAERSEPSRRRGGRREAARPAPPPENDLDDDGLDEDETLPALADDLPEVEPAELSYEDDEPAEEGDDEQDRARKERELRRRARLAKSAEAASVEPPRPPRRRAAFVAHADRQSVLTAVLLARDVRLVEGFWVYPQEDLMTFFRSIATDLRDETPIFLVGFNASPPARDTLQAASLYRGRLDWYDHHDWPPEDLVALREAIGEEAVHVDVGAGSSLPAVIAERTRRSRFSDKLAELATGRFTQHDYERWGRLWWHRLGAVAKKPGERRSDIEPLLAGRPSDLAKESARVTPPPPPPEVEYVSQRDFRLVHFGGYVMVVLEVPEGFDLHLVARVARERYEAQMSLAYSTGGELLVLGGDEGRARRGLDLGGMADHLASKHEWIQSLRDDDHVARIRVRDLHTYPERLDEVIGEIAMGRSIVEG